MNALSEATRHESHIEVSGRIALAAVAFVAAGGLLLAGGSAASAATPGKTVCKKAIASHRVLTATQMKVCQKAKIKVPKKQQPTAVHPTSGTTSTTGRPAPTSGRTVEGTLVTLGAGMFKGGTAVAAGLYNVTPGTGESGNFVVHGTDTYDEILGGGTTAGGVPMVRAKISIGDSITISGLSQVTFTPVTTPYVTTHSPVTLYAGTWTVGQDLGPGRYVATPGTGQSGNFIITSEGVDEILGGSSTTGGVPNVTFTVKKGDVIDISGLSQVTLTPS